MKKDRIKENSRLEGELMESIKGILELEGIYNAVSRVWWDAPHRKNDLSQTIGTTTLNSSKIIQGKKDITSEDIQIVLRQVQIFQMLQEWYGRKIGKVVAGKIKDFQGPSQFFYVADAS